MGIPQPKNKKKKTNGKLKKELWKVFAEYIKKRDKNCCYTCDRTAIGQAMHAGHFIPKAAGGIALYFHEENVHAQCAWCNLFLAGNQYVYGEKLGKETVVRLYKLKQKTEKWTEKDYLEKIEYYKNKLSE